MYIFSSCSKAFKKNKLITCAQHYDILGERDTNYLVASNRM